MQWRQILNEVVQFCISYQKQKQKNHTHADDVGLASDTGFASDNVATSSLELNPQKVAQHFFQPDAEVHWKNTRCIIHSMKAYGLQDHRQAAYILATVWHETNATMQPIKEAYWLSEAWRQQNLSYYPWYGRGYVQLTWEANYKKADDALKLNGQLLKNPDTVMQMEISAQILVWGCMQGWFTGRKISDYISTQHCDYHQARRVVNGMDRADLIAQYAQHWEHAFY